MLHVCLSTREKTYFLKKKTFSEKIIKKGFAKEILTNKQSPMADFAKILTKT